MSGSAAQSRMGLEVKVDAPCTAHLAMGRFNLQAYAQLLIHSLLHVLKVSHALQAFQTLKQTSLLRPCKAENTPIGVRTRQQLIELAVADTWRTWITQHKR
ncbi:hypothetical protein NCCP436_31040 [Pseudomonas sp. NCCP-436]|nr:hypothetical protein NCCP436_31040 [Pseudomonas sp. NCCP-436]